MQGISRRDFLRVSGIMASSLTISTGLSACTEENNQQNANFNHGVASGDPLENSVIIWTRVTPLDLEETINVNYEVATDNKFENLVHSGVETTTKAKDFTIKIDVLNLTAGTKYYYRFKVGNKISPIGEAKTLPIETQKVEFAVFSCANYPNGYFNAYTEASKLNLDATIHLGDYIYEYGIYENDDFEAKKPAYATENAETIGRVFPDDNNKELIELEDYRKRYALYKTDSGLQAIHKVCPMIVVWDDHEIANDTFKTGAQNHNENDGDFDQRVENALQAYFEWLPIRPIANKKEIYRNFNFGKLVNLSMLETRLFGRDEQLDYANYFDANGNFDAQEFTQDITNQNRTMLGKEQLEWLTTNLTNSNATWEVLGQQVLMGKMNLPSEVIISLGNLSNVNQIITELTQLKARMLQNDPTLTEEEKQRVNTVMPYNLDAWDGYFVERETILATAKALNKNLVVLAGDTHNAWSSNLVDMNKERVGVEFATTSVSSPGMEQYLSLDQEGSKQLDQALTLLIDDLNYTETYSRGFMRVTFTNNEAKAKWYFVDNTDSIIYNTIESDEIVVQKG